MISAEEIQKEIIELEKKDTSYAVIERLAWLYVVLGHMKTEKENEHTSRMFGSDFLQACSDKPIDYVLSVIDEHLEAVKVLYPKEYENIIKKIKE